MQATHVVIAARILLVVHILSLVVCDKELDKVRHNVSGRNISTLRRSNYPCECYDATESDALFIERCARTERSHFARTTSAWWILYALKPNGGKKPQTGEARNDQCDDSISHRLTPLVN